MQARLRNLPRSALLATAVAAILTSSAPAALAAEKRVAPGGSDTAACTADAPCASLGRAYRMAQPGDSVAIAGGSYPAQVVPYDASKTASDDVLFAPLGDDKVLLASLRVQADHVEFSDLEVGGWYADQATDVVFRRLTANGPVFVTGGSDIRALGGSVGPAVDKSPELKAPIGSSEPPRNILFDGVTFHDFIKETPGAHVDCLHVMAVDGLVVRNSRFHNCEHFSILFTKWGAAGSPRNVVVENNFMDCCRTGFYSVYLGGGHGEYWRNFKVRFNSANKGFAVGEDTTDEESNVLFDSNVVPGLNPTLCNEPGVEWSYNLASKGKPCGPTDQVAINPFRNPLELDFHVLENSSAAGAGNPDQFPAEDIDGQVRGPSAPDAGADEWHPAPIDPVSPPPTSPGEELPAWTDPVTTTSPLPVVSRKGLISTPRRARVKLRCPRRFGESCHGSVRLRLGRKTSGARRATLKSGATRTIVLRLPARAPRIRRVAARVGLRAAHHGSRDRWSRVVLVRSARR